MRLQSKSPVESSTLPPDGLAITMPSAGNNPCQGLGDYLQRRWNEEVGESSIQLRCAPRRQQLLVLLEHAIAEQPPVSNTFHRIQALLEEAPECLWLGWLGEDEELPDIVESSMFMRVSNVGKSYAERQYDINLMAGVAPGMMPLPVDGLSDGEDLLLEGLQVQTPVELSPTETTSVAGIGVESTNERIGSYQASNRQEIHSRSAFTDGSSDATVESQDSPNSMTQEIEPADESVSTLALRPEQEDESTDTAATDGPVVDTGFPEREAPLAKEPLHIPKSVWAAGLGLCLATFIGSFYIASRPCLVNSCPALDLAAQQGQDATDLLQVANNSEDIEQSRQQFQLALKSLRQVPGWSSYGAEAQGLRSGYRKLIASMTPVQDAFEQADQAEEKTTLGTASPERWREIQVHWEAAIAQLRTVSPQSPLYALAQDKLKQFDEARGQAQTSLEQEQEGERLVQEARGYVTNLAASDAVGEDLLFSLQQTESRLEDAIFTLKKVPKGTAAYREAIRLLSSYQSELAINRGQQTQEAFIVGSYREALLYAEDAKRAEGESRWRDAQDHWRTALNRIDQIPSQSPYFNKAQSLVTEYTYALQAAEQQAEQQAALYRVESELDVLCAGSPKVCTYDVTANKISVQLTLDYERAVLTAGSLGDEDSRTGALRHVQELEAALEASSNAAQIPLELYDPDGVLVGTHQPRRYGEV